MDNVNKMERFFKWDICVKNILYNTAPKDYYGYDNDLIVKYSDSLFKALDDVDYYVSSILSTFNFD